MKDLINNLRTEIKEKLENVSTLKELTELRNIYLSKKGPITELMSHMKDLNNEEKKEFGKIMNEFKTDINNSFDELKNKIEEEELNKKLESEKIDITLPSTKINVGSPNILEKLIECNGDKLEAITELILSTSQILEEDN